MQSNFLINNEINDIENLKNFYNSTERDQLEKKINICYIGAGYVGGTSGAVMAYKCPIDKVKVIICDTSEEKIKAWNSDNVI